MCKIPDIFREDIAHVRVIFPGESFDLPVFHFRKTPCDIGHDHGVSVSYNPPQDECENAGEKIMHTERHKAQDIKKTVNGSGEKLFHDSFPICGYKDNKVVTIIHYI